MIRFAEEKDLERINELRRQVNDMHVKGRPDIFKPGFGREMQDLAREILEYLWDGMCFLYHETGVTVQLGPEDIPCGRDCRRRRSPAAGSRYRVA